MFKLKNGDFGAIVSTFFKTGYSTLNFALNFYRDALKTRRSE